jgi:hypothetical protein
VPAGGAKVQKECTTFESLSRPILTRHEPFVIGNQIQNSRAFCGGIASKKMRLVANDAPPSDLFARGTVFAWIVNFPAMVRVVRRQRLVCRNNDRVLGQNKGVSLSACSVVLIDQTRVRQFRLRLRDPLANERHFALKSKHQSATATICTINKPRTYHNKCAVRDYTTSFLAFF